MAKLSLITTCVQCHGSDVDELLSMIDSSKEVSYQTFARHVDIGAIAPSLGYAYRSGEKGLRLSKDWAVSFYKSKWKGIRCYYMKWSAIEYVFQDKEATC